MFVDQMIIIVQVIRFGFSAMGRAQRTWPLLPRAAPPAVSDFL